MLFYKYLNINFSLSENSCQEKIKKIASGTFRPELHPKLKKSSFIVYLTRFVQNTCEYILKTTTHSQQQPRTDRFPV